MSSHDDILKQELEDVIARVETARQSLDNKQNEQDKRLSDLEDTDAEVRDSKEAS